MSGTVAAAAAQPASSAAPAVSRTVLPDSEGSSEPSIVVDSAGRIFVSAIFGLGNIEYADGTPVWKSEDGGTTFRSTPMASAGPAGTPLGGGDSALALDKRDYVYATELWLGNDSVSVSTDHGSTWIGGPASHRMVGDRNWLAYSPVDDALYQLWNGVDALWVARADLHTPLGEKAALSFAHNYRVTPNTAGLPGEQPRGIAAWPGGIAADAKRGHVYATWSERRGVAVGVSRDKGATWTTTVIPGTAPTGNFFDTAWNFVPVVVDPAGRVFVAWSQIDGGTPNAPEGISVRLASSSDGGRSWHVTRVSQARRTAVFPVVAAYGPGEVGVAWIESAQIGNPNHRATFANAVWTMRHVRVANHGGRRAARLSRTTIDPDVHRGSVFVGPQGGDRAMGDFFSMAVSPRGDTLIAYVRHTGSNDESVVAKLPRRSR